MIRKQFVDTENGRVARVTFTLPGSIWADSIFLVGDFNGWNETSHPFSIGRDQNWSVSIDLQPGREYQFRYCKDGEWMNDSQADGYWSNPYGSDNFIVSTKEE